MDETLTLGEYVKRLRRRSKKSLQTLTDETQLSMSYLSRIENDAAVPNPAAVVRLTKALDGDLETMLAKAACLPSEILERLSRRAADGAGALRRAGTNREDDDFAGALVGDLDPGLRRGIAKQFDVSDEDAEALFEALRQLSTMQPDVLAVAIKAIAGMAGGGESHE